MLPGLDSYPWPENYGEAHTLAGPVERSGVGLHSGIAARVRLQPSERPGYWVGWLSKPFHPLVRLEPSQVADTELCTALQLEGGRLATVEHLLAALAGTGVSQAEILVDGEEVPLLDGSALPWVEAIAEAGLAPLGTSVTAPMVESPVTLQQGSSFATALPAACFQVGAAIEFQDRAIGRQLFSLGLTPQNFVAEIAPARTFGLRSQVDQLLAAGLIKGGCLENALVCDGDKWLNPPLRFNDEPVRHKILDLIGDLALVGLPRAQVFAYRGSHGLHTSLAAVLASCPQSLAA
ncbi:UDP-3-O-acyl-N-acetylglucosamine deacetylase [Cyanobium sp. HWJ4-Hawea]|uniref:UDP-3-O-acyl-N-acetylglucosamine deacetylase n=1 Tax=Cyanobium sp. HWJ4-Hawea TaxID=2823713 RepID=UPI0020CF143F|nr:UDP-3-O-acyl-N-acetylglucosamine deacetylase [Cyanobium sp. HWJ4-Hawea]